MEATGCKVCPQLYMQAYFLELYMSAAGILWLVHLINNPFFLFLQFQDLVLITQTLEENMYDIDLSISYILQMMCVAEIQGMIYRTDMVFIMSHSKELVLCI